MNDYDNHRCRPDHDSIASIALRKIFIGGLSYGTDDGRCLISILFRRLIHKLT